MENYRVFIFTFVTNPFVFNRDQLITFQNNYSRHRFGLNTKNCVYRAREFKVKNCVVNILQKFWRKMGYRSCHNKKINERNIRTFAEIARTKAIELVRTLRVTYCCAVVNVRLVLLLIAIHINK